MLTTISDKKVGHSSNGATVDYYRAVVLNQTNYYSGGMQMPVRRSDSLLFINTFDAGTDGWAVYNVGTLQNDNGRLKFTGTVAWSTPKKALTLEEGRQYRIRFTIDMGNCSDLHVPVYKSDISSYVVMDGVGISVTASGSYEGTFTATSNNMLLLIEMIPGVNPPPGSAGYYWIDDVSLERLGPVDSIGVEYRYGFNGQMKSNEIGENSYTALYWEYDSRPGRRWNLEPLAKQFPELSHYATNNNNPILNDDPNGAETKSIHVDDKGKVLKNINDGDNTVFIHKAGTTAADIDKSYTSIEHSAGGTKIGEIGKTINVDVILKNILQDHRSEMVNAQSPKLSWFENVLPGHRWDLKANQKTIFGTAWAFDGNSETKTAFTFNNGLLNLEFANAADVGNYHAGYTGTYANISYQVQRLFAGAGEKAKNASVGDGKNFWGNSWLSPPFMDRKPDYFWNKMGMVAADYDRKIKATINPKPVYNIQPTYIDATYLKPPILPR